MLLKLLKKYVQGKASLPDTVEDNTKMLVEALAKSYNKNPFKMEVVNNDKFNN